MVTIVDYKTYEKEDGTTFNALVVQGGIEVVKNQETGRTYLTARTTRIPCTFDELTCKNLIGSDLPGQVMKVEVEPYEYANPTTGEIVVLHHSYNYVSEEESIVKNNVIEKELVL